MCFKCKRELPLDMFYKHPRMADGHLNKCKECTKKDANKDYERKSQNDEWMEKERVRGREKYKRLGRKNHDKTHNKIARKANLLIRRRLKSKKPNFDIHHWNYNLPYDVFIISKRWHSRIHKKLVYNNESKCFVFKGEILDTKNKHEKAIREILKIPEDVIVEQIILSNGEIIQRNTDNVILGKIKRHHEKSCGCYNKTDDSLIMKFESISEASRKTGVSKSTIIEQCNGSSESKTNVYWKYF